MQSTLRQTSRKAGTRTWGLALAGATAVVSGFSVFVNGYGVRAWSGTADPTTYTTAKNIVAAVILIGVAAGMRRANGGDAWRLPEDRRSRWMLGLIAVIGGSIPFVLFFEGLATATSDQAAFIHKTLVIWVAIMAPMLLRERLRPIHGAAITLLVAGQLLMVGGLGEVNFGPGEWSILGATLLWSFEVIAAKKLLTNVTSMTVAISRMAGGGVLLVIWGLAQGDLGAFARVGVVQWLWVLGTGVMLAAYVGTWYAALSRAPAIDVTAILVGGALVTAALRTGFAATPLPDVTGLLLVAIGVCTILLTYQRRLAA